MTASPRVAGTPLVGRSHERSVIDEALDDLAVGRAGAVIVHGDAGVGKTSLVQDVCSDPGDAIVLYGTCLPLETVRMSFGGIRALLRGADPALDPPRGEEAVPSDPTFMTRFDDWLTDLCAMRPVILVLDDVHWADQSTLDTVTYVVAGPVARPLTVIAAVRSGEAADRRLFRRWLTNLRRLPRVRDLPVLPLDREATAAQITQLMADEPHRSLIDETFARGGGNPYLTRLLVSGVSASSRSLPHGIPADLRSAIHDRWQGIESRTREAATMLALAGTPTTSAGLAAAVGTSGERVRADLDTAIERGDVYEAETGALWFRHPLHAEVLAASMSADEAVRWHSRLADHLELLPAHTPEELVLLADHRFRAGDLDRAYTSALRAADAAELSVQPLISVRMLKRAVALRHEVSEAEASGAQLLRRLLAEAEVAGDLRAEADAIEALLESEGPDVDTRERTMLLVRRAHIRFVYGSAFLDLSDAREAERTGAEHPESAEYAVALAELAHSGLWHQDTEARTNAERALALARDCGDDHALTYALTANAMLACVVDFDPRGHALAVEAVDAAARARDWWGFVHATLWEGNSLETWASTIYADVLARRREQLIDQGAPLFFTAWLASSEAASLMASGNPSRCAERLRETFAVDPGPIADAQARLTAARLAMWQGNQRDAEQHLARVDEIFVVRSDFVALPFDAVRAEVCVGAGDWEGAWAAVLRAADASVPPTMCEWLMPLAARAIADRMEAARDRGTDVSRECALLDDLTERFPKVIADLGISTPLARRQLAAFQAAYDAECARARDEEEQGDRWVLAAELLADSALVWEECYARRRAAESLIAREGDRRRGAEQLRLGLALADRLEARALAAELRSLSRRSHVPVRVSEPVDTDSLGALARITPREAEVLSLVVAGRTYAEIAHELVISEKTVSTHISHLLAKTGTTNRVELAGRADRLRRGAAGLE